VANLSALVASIIHIFSPLLPLSARYLAAVVGDEKEASYLLARQAAAGVETSCPALSCNGIHNTA